MAKYVYDHAQVQPTGLSGPGVEKAQRMRGLRCSEPCRQGATAADQAHLQARRRAIGGIMRLPMCSRSGDGSCGTWRSRGTACWRPRRQIGTPELMGRGGELCGHGLSCGGAIGTGHWHGCGASLGALVGHVGAHRRWPVSICLLSKATPNFPQSCLARGALTGPLVGLRWRHVAGPIANPPG